MKKLLVGLIGAVLFQPVFAADVRDYRGDFLKKCAKEGEHKKVCVCLYDSWTRSLSSTSSPSAVAAARIISTHEEGQIPARQDIMQAARHLQKFDEAAEKCLDPEDQDIYAESSHDSMGMPPQMMGMGGMGQMNPEQQQQMQMMMQMMQGGDHQQMMQNLQKMDDNRLQQREVQQRERAQRQDQQANLSKAFYAKYDPLVKKFDGLSDVTKSPISDYKELYLLKCVGIDDSDRAQVSSCQCAWNVVSNKLAEDGPVQRGAAFIRSMPEGDISIPSKYRKRAFDLAFKTRDAVRSQCFKRGGGPYSNF